MSGTLIVYTVYSYEEAEIKGVFKSINGAEEWIAKNREGNEDDCKIEDWYVEVTK